MKARLRKFARRSLASALQISGVLGIRRNLSSCVVLMYHRTVDPASVPFPIQAGMYVRPETFRMQMKFLSRTANIISLDELLKYFRQQQSPPRRSVVITFDDGWLDNREFALPALKEFQLPATIFLPTAYIGGRDLFWTDAVSVALRDQKSRERLIDAFQSRTLLDRMRRESCETGSAVFKQITSASPEALEPALRYLFDLQVNERQSVIDVVSELIADEHNRLPRQFLNWNEVREMYSRGISFGSHSHRHLLATELETGAVAADYTDSMTAFANENVDPVAAYCYPGGAFNDITQKELSNSRISFALTTRRESDPNATPRLFGRIGIHDDVSYTPALFAARIWGGPKW